MGAGVGVANLQTKSCRMQISRSLLGHVLRLLRGQYSRYKTSPAASEGGYCEPDRFASPHAEKFGCP